jgi:uncharacterized protein (DUF3820 family)
MLRMPWGKYKGRPLTEVPAGYLAWVLEECDNVRGEFRRALELELIARLGLEVRPAGAFRAPAPPRPPANWSEIVRRWHREMALEFHPDRGGSNEACQALNAAHDRLQELLDEADDVLDDEDEDEF